MDGTTKNFGYLGNMIARTLVKNFDDYRKTNKDIVNFLFSFTYKQWKDLNAYNKVFAALAERSDRLNNIDCYEILRGLSEVDL